MLKRALPFIVGYLMLFVLMVVLIVAYPKGELHILLNSIHTKMGDTLFKFLTLLAEWPLYVVAVLSLLVCKKWWVVFYAACECVSATLVTALKYIFRMPRPATFFHDRVSAYLPVVDGVHLHHAPSFPSGHASTFFIFVTVTVILLSIHYRILQHRNIRYIALFSCQIALLLLAALGAYSRIYLSQHFLEDVFAGSIIGVVVPFAMFSFFATKLKKDRATTQTGSDSDPESHSPQTTN